MQDVDNLNLNLEGNIIREKWRNSGFEDDFDRITEAYEISPELVHNLIHIGAASAVQQTYSDAERECGVDLEPFNVRAIGVFAHLLDEHGDDVFEVWTDNSGYERDYAFGDIDMYFPAGRETELESRPSVDQIYEARLGQEIKESANGDNLNGEKYTATLDFADSFEIEMDFIRPPTASESEYPMAESNPVRVETPGGAPLSVPPLEECILHKGTLEQDNGDGYDTMREKDYRELSSLFSIAEERGLEPEHFEEEFGEADLADISTRAAGIAEVPDAWNYQPSDDYIARIDQWKHIYGE